MVLRAPRARAPCPTMVKLPPHAVWYVVAWYSFLLVAAVPVRGGSYPEVHQPEKPPTRKTTRPLAWLQATPLFISLVACTQILLFWTMGEEREPGSLGLIAPDPQPSIIRFELAMGRLNVSNVTEFFAAAPEAAARFGDVDAAQLAHLRAARSAPRWLSYLLAHASASDLDQQR